MAQHFFKISHSYSQKNKLYKAFFDYIKSVDATLLTSDVAKNNFLESLRSVMAQLNAKHSRCKPISFSGYPSVHDYSQLVEVSGSFTAEIYQVKKEMYGQ